MAEEKETWNQSITEDAPSNAQDVRTLYDGFSSQYNSAVESWGYTAPNVVTDYLIRTTPLDAHILDAGCGTGLTGAALVQRGFFHITGSDLSPDSLALAKKTGHYQQLHVLNLGETLPFQNDMFGGIICVGVFSYIPDLKPVLRELLRVLTPGGTLVFTQREDHFRTYNNAKVFDDLQAKGGFDRLVETSPQPYLPGNPGFAEHIGIHYCVWLKTIDAPTDRNALLTRNYHTT